MSNTAIKWALGQPVSKSSAKFVLVVMADLADDDEMTCYPSIAHLAKSTGQDVKTVQSGLHRLRQEGYIADTGNRCGLTGQVIVYRLNTPAFGGVQPLDKTPEISSNTPKNGSAESDQKTPGFPFNTSENGDVPSESKTPAFPDKTPVFPAKDPQISLETPPKTGDGHIKDTSRTPITQKKSATDRVDLLVGVPERVIEDYLAVRKAKRAGALTETAVDGLKREAGKAGLSLPEAVRACCEFSWQGFNAGWYAQRVGSQAQRGGVQQPRKPSSHAGLASQKYSSGVNADGTFA